MLVLLPCPFFDTRLYLIKSMMLVIAVTATILAFVQNMVMFSLGMKEMAIFVFPSHSLGFFLPKSHWYGRDTSVSADSFPTVAHWYWRGGRLSFWEQRNRCFRRAISQSSFNTRKENMFSNRSSRQVARLKR